MTATKEVASHTDEAASLRQKKNMNKNKNKDKDKNKNKNKNEEHGPNKWRRSPFVRCCHEKMGASPH